MSPNIPPAAQTPNDSVTTPGRPSANPSFLHTPPVSEGSQSRQSYFPPGSFRSPNHKNRTASPDNLASPAVSLGGSLYSSNTGHSGHSGHSACSYSSGEYGEFLTPPLFQGDSDKPPYVPRRERSESLSMVKKLRRAQTIAIDTKIKIRRRRRRHRCKHNKMSLDDQQSASMRAIPCQVAPTAPPGQKELCSAHAGNFVPRNTHQGNTDTYGRLVSSSMPGPSPPVVNRRWSSVEMGAHRFTLKPTQSGRGPGISTEQSSKPPQGGIARSLTGQSSRTDRSASITRHNLMSRTPKATSSRGAAHHEIVKAVRKRLTVREIGLDKADSHVKPPLSITLRRASGASMASKKASDEDNGPGGSSEATTPRAEVRDNRQQGEIPVRYLITSDDIDSIAEFIAVNLKRRKHSRNRSRTSTVSSRYTRSPNNSSKAFTPSMSSNLSLAEPSIPGTDVHHFNGRPRDQTSYLQVGAATFSSLHKFDSKKSVHELIWKESRNSTGNFGSDEEPNSSSPLGETSSDLASSPDILPESKKQSAAAKYTGDAFDPNNARASISEWSWRLQQNRIPGVVTSSDSESTDAIPKPSSRPEQAKVRSRPPLKSVASTPKERVVPRVRPFPRYTASHEQLQDVVSFPPLSTRKATSEWLSPLPAMESSPASTMLYWTTSRSLYDLGVDVNVGPSGSATPKMPITSWVRSAEASRSPSPCIEFRKDYGFGPLSTDSTMDNGGRRKSVLKQHPKASSRIGESSRMGASIGNYSKDRRMSTMPRIQRVQTIDNIHKGEHEIPPSRWRAPSICPPRLSLSQVSVSAAEYEEATQGGVEDRMPEILARLQRSRSGCTDRISMIEAKSPDLPKVDRAGIYGTITGTLRRSIAAPCEVDPADHTCGECADQRTPSVDWIG
ncbi:unnamed protein product [Diplocarpon coronariae]|uniref:Uncharacterized protein n=1 Tax=Diplocarpon coronariae TaxID=2795749 RepID=A0A218Z9Q3_9HELO|nr:hypothetical protein B2J93_4539 [Marssonina coronariae]